MFHNTDDSYPNGDPDGMDPEVLLSQFAARGINIFFSEITKSTDIMLAVWRKTYERYFPGKEIRSFKMTEIDQFLPLISDAIATALTE